MLFVSVGAILLMIAAVFGFGERFHTAQLMFSRALIGFIFAPLNCERRYRWIRTAARYALPARVLGHAAISFFFGITHLVLVDMALQFSRPLFMILLAFLFLGEVWRSASRSLLLLLRHTIMLSHLAAASIPTE